MPNRPCSGAGGSSKQITVRTDSSSALSDVGLAHRHLKSQKVSRWQPGGARSAKHLGEGRACSLANGESLLGSLLLGQSDGLLLSLLDTLSLLGGDELDVAVGGQVGSNSTVGSVGSSSALDGSLDGEVADEGLFNIESLSLSVSLEVLEELDDVANGLLGESTLGNTVKLGLGGSADVAGESSVRNAVSVLEDVLQVLDGSLQLQALDGSGGFVGVLEVSSKIINSGLGRYNSA